MGMIKPAYTIHNNEDGTYKVIAKAPFGGFEPSEITLTSEQLKRFEEWRSTNRALIQDYMPELSASEREILLSGISPKDWERLA